MQAISSTSPTATGRQSGDMWQGELTFVCCGFSSGEATGQMIDKETRDVVDQQYERVKKLLLQHQERPMLWREYFGDGFMCVMHKANERRWLLTSVGSEQGSVLHVAPASAKAGEAPLAHRKQLLCRHDTQGTLWKAWFPATRPGCDKD